MAESAGFHFDADLAGAWVGKSAFDDFDRAVGGRDLGYTHGFMMRVCAVTSQLVLICDIFSMG